MSTSRRVLTLVGLTVAVLIGAIAPASAAFSEPEPRELTC